mmetsp:Transcript_806/g.2603  ORF Transcript_806/g.2603 Transcript_806/m.2603 type:complete len:238 (+) Transcript_806:3933-4646(+)
MNMSPRSSHSIKPRLNCPIILRSANHAFWNLSRSSLSASLSFVWPLLSELLSKTGVFSAWPWLFVSLLWLWRRFIISLPPNHSVPYSGWLSSSARGSSNCGSCSAGSVAKFAAGSVAESFNGRVLGVVEARRCASGSFSAAASVFTTVLGPVTLWRLRSTKLASDEFFLSACRMCRFRRSLLSGGSQWAAGGRTRGDCSCSVSVRTLSLDLSGPSSVAAEARALLSLVHVDDTVVAD